MFGPNGHMIAPNFGIKAFSSVWVPLLSAQK